MTNDPPGAGPGAPPHIDTTVPHSARIWNYWLGGTDNYPVDRAAGDQYREIYPQIVDVARASRAFQVRAVRFLAGEAGLRQFLDVGAGLPAVENTHETAQAIADGCRVVDGLPVGSYLALQDGVMATETFNEAQQGYDDTGAIPYRLRRPEQIAAFFGDLDVVDPGLVALPRWRPDPGQAGPDVDSVGGVARKTAPA